MTRRITPSARAAFSLPKIKLAKVSHHPRASRLAILFTLANNTIFLFIACPAGCQKCSDSSVCDVCGPVDGAFAFFDEATALCASGCTGEGCRKHSSDYTFNLLDDSDRCLKGYTYSGKYNTCLKLVRNCAEDKLSYTAQKGTSTPAYKDAPATFTYYLGSPEWTYTPLITHSED